MHTGTAERRPFHYAYFSERMEPQMAALKTQGLQTHAPSMAPESHYDKAAADYAVAFIESLCHTKGKWAGKPFELIDWQERIVRDIFGVLKPTVTAV
jgi:phage terminase large subunit-like protein